MAGKIEEIIGKEQEAYKSWAKNSQKKSWIATALGEGVKRSQVYTQLEGFTTSAAAKAAEVSPKTIDVTEYNYLAALKRDAFSRYASRRQIYAAGINNRLFGTENIKAQIDLIK